MSSEKKRIKKKDASKKLRKMVSTNLEMKLCPQCDWNTPSRDEEKDVDRWLFCNFRFTPKPVLQSDIYDEDREIYNSAFSGDETEDEEERIQSSWHHRALLGDEGRVPYNDCIDDIDVSDDDDAESGEEDNVVIFTNVGT
jgi:hypothetical protein